jgi:uncharacterized 2Fe-2S/4Fe-4S cluster protein (DUF4445 family)
MIYLQVVDNVVVNRVVSPEIDEPGLVKEPEGQSIDIGYVYDVENDIFLPSGQDFEITYNKCVNQFESEIEYYETLMSKEFYQTNYTDVDREIIQAFYDKLIETINVLKNESNVYNKYLYAKTFFVPFEPYGKINLDEVE